MTIARMKAGLLFGSGFHYRSIKLEGATESWSETSRNGNLSPGRQVRSESFFSQASGSLQMDQKKNPSRRELWNQRYCKYSTKFCRSF